LEKWVEMFLSSLLVLSIFQSPSWTLKELAVLNFAQYKFKMHTRKWGSATRRGCKQKRRGGEEDANRKGGEEEWWESRIRETLSITLKEKLKPECWLPLKMVHRNAPGTSISSNCVATPMRC
jgi:hypothetical protein